MEEGGGVLTSFVVVGEWRAAIHECAIFVKLSQDKTQMGGERKRESGKKW